MSAWWVLLATAAALLALVLPTAAATDLTDPRLSATLVGRLEAGATGRLAVHWDGPSGALLDLWVDLDGDGIAASHELVVEGRHLTPGIEVVSFDLPPGVEVVPDPTVWVRARTGGWCDQGATVAAAAPGDNGDVCGWQPGFEGWRLMGSAQAMAVFDDGFGSALYVGGSFDLLGVSPVNNIARWDGVAWSALGAEGETGVDGSVTALAVFDDGSSPALYVGGSFETAGGVMVNSIARWDGSAWSALGGPSGLGLSGVVWALTVYDDGSGPALLAGGYFATAGGVMVNNIARWDGTAWSALSGPSGTGTNGVIRTLAAFNEGSGPALFAGGAFSTAGGVAVSNIARWDGSSWSDLNGPSGSGVNGTVLALAAHDDGSGPALYAGGVFTVAGDLSVNHIARWNGSSWSALSGPSGAGTSDIILALAVFDHGSGPALYAGGHFNSAGGVTVSNIARWDGSAWSALSGPSGTGVSGWALALTTFDGGTGPSLFVGGEFTNAGGVTANGIARWDGGAWFPFSGKGMESTVSSLAVFDDGTGPALFAGGEFTTAGGVTVNGIARWDSRSWSALSGPSGTGMGGQHPWVDALAVFDDGFGPALYAGGQFGTAGGVTVSGIARWDGSEWSALSGPSGTGVSGGVRALAVFDDDTGPALYAGGYFETAGGVTVNHIARWDGTTWSDLSGPSGTGVHADPWFGVGVYALAVFDDGTGPALYVGGTFETAGGVTVNNIARWDGSDWAALNGPAGTGVGYYEVSALAVSYDASGPALFAGGSFANAGGVVVNNIARWDGAVWSALSAEGETGVDGSVTALAVFDEGSGAALYAGGWIWSAGGVVVNNIARWNGGEWSALAGPAGTGASDWVLALAVFDGGSGPTLYAGGSFWTAGGLPSGHVAAWRCFHGIFADDFEDGSTAAWSLTVP